VPEQQRRDPASLATQLSDLEDEGSRIARSLGGWTLSAQTQATHEAQG